MRLKTMMVGALALAALMTGCLTNSPSGGGQAFNDSIGLEWTRHYNGQYYGLESVVWTGRNFVAAGDRGTLLTSPDGLAWTYRPMENFGIPETEDVSSLAHGGGTVLAVIPADGVIWSSGDHGVTWTRRGRPLPGLSAEWVTWGNATFVAFAQDSAGRVALTSPDGISWTKGGVVPAYATVAAWVGDQWIAVGPTAIMTSPDGLAWTSRTVPVGAVEPRGIARVGQTLVIVGGNEGVLTSPDGVNWTLGPVEPSGYLVGMARRGGVTLAVGEKILATNDGLNWTEETVRFNGEFLAAACDEATCVSVGYEGTIATSVNGGDWRNQSLHKAPIDPPHFHDIAWSGSLFATVGYNGTLLTSPDGKAWTRRASGTTERLEKVISAQGGFLAAGGGKVLYSKDGASWVSVDNTVGGMTPVRAGGKWYVFGNVGFITSTNGSAWTTTYVDDIPGGSNIVWTGNLFVAASGFGNVATSPDGSVWTTRDPGTDEWLSSITWSGTRLMIMASESVLTSPDGITWERHPLPEDQRDLRDVAWVGNRFVAVGGAGLVVTSPDGTEWTTQEKVTSRALFALAASPGRAVAVGWSGTILTSP